MSPCLILTNIKTLAYASVFLYCINKNIFADGEHGKNSVTEKITATAMNKKTYQQSIKKTTAGNSDLMNDTGNIIRA